MLKRVVSNLWSFLVDRPLSAGTKIDKYLVSSVLGMGSYGISYIVKDENTGNLYVLKQTRKTKAGTKKGLKAFEYEKNLLRQLRHPCIPSLHDVIENEQGRFLVMDYIQGLTFEDLIFENGKTFAEEEAISILFKVLDITAYFHRRGVVHRDLRIPNILNDGGDIFIIDFGLARFLSDASEENDDGPIEKKLMRTISIQSDIYALGHFLLFLLYSTYEPVSLREKSWEEELQLMPELTMIIRRMLQLEQPYENIEMLEKDLKTYLALKNRGNIDGLV